MSGSPFADGTILVGLPVTNTWHATIRTEADETTQKKLHLPLLLNDFEPMVTHSLFICARCRQQCAALNGEAAELPRACPWLPCLSPRR